MIKLADATLLALTKLRTRKIRTFVTILLASLLFGALVTTSLVVTGGLRSVDSFREDGLTSRYIVHVASVPSHDSFYHMLRDPQLLAEAKKRYEQLVAEKSAEAKRLGLPYNQASDQPPYEVTFNGEERLIPMGRNKIAQDLLDEKFSGQSSLDDAELKTVANRYGATDIFHSEYYHIPRGSTLEAYADGKEAYYDLNDNDARNEHYKPSLINGTSMTLSPPEITEPFMLPGNAGWQPDGTSLPVILPQNTVEQLLGMTPLPDTASASEKLAHLRQIRTSAADLSFQACYRNQASTELIQATIRQQKDMQLNSNDKDYEKPSVIYTLPDPARCENPHIQEDSRTTEQKQLDAKQKLFDQKFAMDAEPTSYFATLKVVGISPSEPETGQNIPARQATSIDDVVGELLKTTGIGQTIPRALYDQLSTNDKIKYAELFTYTPVYLFGAEDNKGRFVEFATAKDAQKFIDEQGCTNQMDGTCKPADRPYQLMLYFTNSAALEDIRAKTAEWLGYAMLGAIILAAAIMWIAVGRTIADGRRETAVFRAIGFNRADIMSVYALYTAILSALVAVLAAGLGWLGAYILHRQLSPELTTQAQYGFGGLDMEKAVNLVGFDWSQLGYILLACFLTGLISTIIPLLRNVRRNPIRDMRDE